MSLAGSYSFAVQRGADFSRTFRRTVQATGQPVNLTGLKARMQVRTPKGATGTSTSDTLVLELTDGNGIAVSDPADGKVTLNLTALQTIELAEDNTRTKLAYGIELYDDSGAEEVVMAFLQGSITVRTEVVRG